MSSKFKCRGCKLFFPKPAVTINGGTFHTLDCAISYAQEKSNKLRVKTNKIRVKAEKKSHTAAKKALKDNDKSYQTKKAQQIFNRFIRLRDNDKPCISCSRHHTGQYHAGHYRSVGSCPELRFDPRNCFKQCAPCNNHLSGNLVNYRVRLVSSFDRSLIDWIEGPHEPKRYTIDNLKTIQKWFRRKTKRLES